MSDHQHNPKHDKNQRQDQARNQTKPRPRLRVTRRNFLRGVGLAAASAAVAACESPTAAPNPATYKLGTQGIDTRSIDLLPQPPTATPIPLVNQYPEVPFTPKQPPEPGVFQVLTMHEAQTVEALTARILPGTPDDPGAREAGVVNYIDFMLAFNEGYNEATYRHPPFAQIYTGDTPPVQAGAEVTSEATPHGTVTPTPTPMPTTQPAPSPSPTPTITPPSPTDGTVAQHDDVTGTARLSDTLAAQGAGLSNVSQAQPAGQTAISYQVVWIPAGEIERYGYQSILTPREVYRIGLAAVDRYANSKYNQDFVNLSEEQQDAIIGEMAEGKIQDFDKNLTATSFFHNLRRHTAEGMFSDPAYGGNRNLAGWKLVGYPGAQRAYEPREFQSEGTTRQPQSLAQMHAFNAGMPANEHVVLPVSGSEQHQPGHTQWEPAGN